MNPLLLKLALALVSRKLNENKEDKQKSDFNPKELVKAVPLWAVIITLLAEVFTSPTFINAVGTSAGF